MLRKLFESFKSIKPLPLPLPNTGKLCNCYGDITTKNNKECEYFPLEGGYHTAFLVGECISCGGLSGFPHSNLELAINQRTKEGKELLKEIGYKFLDTVK